MKFNRRTILKGLLAAPVVAVVPALAEKASKFNAFDGEIAKKSIYRDELLRGYKGTLHRPIKNNPKLVDDRIDGVKVEVGDTIKITGVKDFTGTYRVSDMS